MDTISLLNIYKESLSKILKVDPSNIVIYKDDKIIGKLIYSKSEEEAREDHKLYGEGEFSMDDYVYVSNSFNVGNYSIKLEVEDNQYLISTFKLYQLPHCCAYMVSCNVSIEYLFQNKGIGTLLNKFRIDIGKLLGYSSIICTSLESNKFQKSILEKNNWKTIHTRKNKRTNNIINLQCIDI